MQENHIYLDLISVDDTYPKWKRLFSGGESDVATIAFSEDVNSIYLDLFDFVKKMSGIWRWKLECKYASNLFHMQFCCYVSNTTTFSSAIKSLNVFG